MKFSFWLSVSRKKPNEDIGVGSVILFKKVQKIALIRKSRSVKGKVVNLVSPSDNFSLICVK